MQKLSKAIVYHFWSNKNLTKFDQNNCEFGGTRNPILLSAAVLRATNPDIPIYILDIGMNLKKTEYTERMNLKIVHWKHHLQRYQQDSHLSDWEARLYSRLFDLRRFDNEIPEDIIIYNDSDVYWLSDPVTCLSGNTDNFCWNGWNSGFFYYNKHKNDYFFDLFDAYGVVGTVNKGISLREYKPVCKYKTIFGAILNDEIQLHYMQQHHAKLFHNIPNEEHYIIRNWLEYPHLFSLNKTPLMLHCNGFNEINRGLIAIYFYEFRDKLLKIFTESEIFDMFKILRIPSGELIKDKYKDVTFMAQLVRNQNEIFSNFLGKGKCIPI